MSVEQLPEVPGHAVSIEHVDPTSPASVAVCECDWRSEVGSDERTARARWWLQHAAEIVEG